MLEYHQYKHLFLEISVPYSPHVLTCCLKQSPLWISPIFTALYSKIPEQEINKSLDDLQVGVPTHHKIQVWLFHYPTPLFPVHKIVGNDEEKTKKNQPINAWLQAWCY